MLIKVLLVVFSVVILVFGASKDARYGSNAQLENLIINPAQACCKG